MNLIARLVGLAALGLTVIPAILFATGALAESTMKTAMVVGAILWFAAAPFALKGGE